MSGNLIVMTDMGSAATIASKAETALADFKNPFTPSAAAVIMKQMMTKVTQQWLQMMMTMQL